MKKIFICLLLISAAYNYANAQKAKYVILITIDGGRPEFYKDTSWHAVHMRQLAAEGSYADGVTSMFPSITYPSHTAIVTGVAPATHGVFYNGMFEPDSVEGKIYWNYKSIKVPTLWSLADEHRLKTASVLWPVSADAPVEYNIPDIGSMGETVRDNYSRPAGFAQEVRKKLFDNVPKIDYGKNINAAKIASYIIKKEQPNFMTVHFLQTDGAEHREGREGALVRQAVKDADSGLAIIESALKDAGIYDSTVIIVTGDHGFCTIKKSVKPNVWLAKAGLIRNLNNGDWKAQFFTEGGSAFLYLKDKNDSATLRQVNQILTSLPADKKKLFRIIDKEKLIKIGADPNVAFSISGLDGTAFKEGFEGEDLKDGHGGAHGYYPDFHEIQTAPVA